MPMARALDGLRSWQPALRRGEWAQALRALDLAAPKGPDAAAWRGLLLVKLGRPDEAVPVLRAAVAVPKTPAWAHAVLGEALRAAGGRLRGFGHVQKFLVDDPKGDGARLVLAALPPRLEREDAWIAGALGGALRSLGRLDEAQAQLSRAVELDAGCGWAWGWLGEVHLRAGRAKEALDALTRAVGLFAEWPQAYAWRAEAYRTLGDADSSLRDLDHVVALGQRDYAVLVSRAGARLERGDEAGYEADLREAVRAAPEVFRAKAAELGSAGGLEVVTRTIAAAERAGALLARSGDAERAGDGEGALALARQALEADPGSAAAQLAVAAALENLRRFQEAYDAAQAAAALGPGPQAYALRARVARQLGYLEAALRDASVALALAPEPGLLQWRAEAFLGMRHYDLALKDITAALELSPDDGALYDLRAHVNLILGRAGEAQQDVERALAIAPGHVSLRLRQAQLLALQGRLKEAGALAASLRRAAPAWGAFLAGYVACAARDYALAGRRFEEALDLAGDDETLRRQASFYAPVAKAVGALNTGESMKRTKAAAAAKGQVYLCGLGVFPPQTATVEVLQAISECDVIFNNLPGIGISEFLGLFCKRRRPVAFRYEQDAVLCGDLILSEVAAGKTVGFVTFGHPLLFGPLSHNVIKVCKSKGIAWKAFGAVSSMDAALAAGGMVMGYSYPGFQVFEMTSDSGLKHLERASNQLPIVVYFADGMGEDGLKGLLKALSARFPSTHKVLLFGPRMETVGGGEDGLTLKQLSKIAQHKLSQGVLFVPPVAA